MSKQEEIIEVCGKKVVVRYTRDCAPCEKCVFDNTGCNADCSQLDRVGMEIYERAYFVEAEQPQADLEAEIERWWNERYSKVDKNYKFDSTRGHYLDNEGIIDLARHIAEWERKRTLDKVVEWMKANLTYTHPRKGDEACMVNIPAFRDAMNEDNT